MAAKKAIGSRIFRATPTPDFSRLLFWRGFVGRTGEEQTKREGRQAQDEEAEAGYDDSPRVADIGNQTAGTLMNTEQVENDEKEPGKGKGQEKSTDETDASEQLAKGDFVV